MTKEELAEKAKNWDGSLYKVLLPEGKSFHGGDFTYDLPKDGKPGQWTPVIDTPKIDNRGYHFSDRNQILIVGCLEERKNESNCIARI